MHAARISFGLGVAVAALVTLAARPAAGAGGILLSADFDDKPIDEPIGQGGASAAEPVQVDGNVSAIVRDSPTATPSLEISDIDDFAAGFVRFELLNGVEATEGTLTIDVDLWFDVFDAYGLYVREPGSSVFQFATLRFISNGSVSLSDTAGDVGTVGTYETARAYPVRLVYRMNEGTYDLWLDGTEVVTARAHGVTTRGAGAMLFGPTSDGNLDGMVYVDNLTVTGEGVTPAAPRSWGAVKALHRSAR
jgi:hypothetical protein